MQFVHQNFFENQQFEAPRSAAHWREELRYLKNFGFSAIIQCFFAACAVCARPFIQKSDMQRHEVTHSSENSVPCIHERCQKRFKTVKNMRNHLLTHSNEKPFKCGFCDKAFKLDRQLKLHERAHDRVKDYTCSVCGEFLKILSDFRYQLFFRKRIHYERSFEVSLRCAHQQQTFQVPELLQRLQTTS
jgi:hypothetical protein